MGRASAGTTHGLQCPDCATDLESELEGSNGVLRFSAPAAAAAFGRAHQPQPGEPTPEVAASPGPTTSLSARSRCAGGPWCSGFWNAFTGRSPSSAPLLFLLGGFIPVLGGWLRNEIYGWADVVRPLGGVWFRVETSDPDSDLGPVLARVDAPLFSSIDTVARRLGVRPPGQVRLTYLPCCGVVAWGRSQALIIGLPLF